MKKTELAIGDSTELEISYYTGPARTRERKYVQVVSNDVASGFNRLEVTADVKPRPDTLLTLTYSPYVLEFAGEKNDKLRENKVEFINTGDEEYRFQILDYPADFFEVKLSHETLKPGKKIELKVKPVKNFSPSIVKKSITLKIEGEKEFRITIPLKKENPRIEIRSQVEGR